MIFDKCKGVLCVDFGESFQTHIFLQNFVSIQPRTSPAKFALTTALSRGTPPARTLREETAGAEREAAAIERESADAAGEVCGGVNFR